MIEEIGSKISTFVELFYCKESDLPQNLTIGSCAAYLLKQRERERALFLAKAQSLLTKIYQENVWTNGDDTQSRFYNEYCETINHLVFEYSVLTPKRANLILMEWGNICPRKCQIEMVSEEMETEMNIIKI